MDLKDLSAIADRYKTVRANRLQADKIARDLKTEEVKLHNQIVQTMRDNDMASVGGRTVILRYKPRTKFIADDWSLVYTFIKECDAFDLLHKRLGQEAVRLRRDDGIIVPGTTDIPDDTLTVSEPLK